MSYDRHPLPAGPLSLLGLWSLVANADQGAIREHRPNGEFEGGTSFGNLHSLHSVLCGPMEKTEDPSPRSKMLVERLRDESMGYFRRSMYQRFKAKLLPREVDGVIDAVLAGMHPSLDHHRMKREVIRRLKALG